MRSENEVIVALKVAVADERRSMRAVLSNLAELDARRLFVGRGFPSAFIYCTRELKYGEGAAYKRVQAARAVRSFPKLLDMLEEGLLPLSTIAAISSHLKTENFNDIVGRCLGKSTREVEFVVAGLAPKPIASDIVRSISLTSRGNTTEFPAMTIPQSTAPPAPGQIGPATNRMVALTSALVRISFTANRNTMDKLERAVALMRHKYPDGRIESVIDEALEALLNQKDPDRRQNPAPHKTITSDRRIPQWVKDEVWKRDNGRCAFRTAEAARCSETAWLEYDHILPFARGGRSDVPTNVRLLCRAHNQWAARQVFGEYQPR